MASHRKEEEHEYAEPLLEEGRDRDSHDDNDIELTELNGEIDRYERRPLEYDDRPKTATKDLKSILMIAGALTITVLGFVINTESTAYFEDVLNWKKPFATMYLMHSSLSLPWFCHVLYLRLTNLSTPWRQFVKDYNDSLRASIASIDAYTTTTPLLSKYLKRSTQTAGPLDFLATTMALVTLVLTISGCSWFVALALTTPADLTAIYNCSTFFAAIFSVPILKERLGPFSIIAVALSIAGTFLIAYGDTVSSPKGPETAAPSDGDASSKVGTSRLLGNLVACIGAVAFGLYEVLFKKYASPSRPMSPSSSLPLTLAASALTGFYTFGTLWLLILFLHIFGLEVFEFPTLYDILYIVIATLSGAVSITLLAVLVVWTNPIFGSMANVLSMFFVALADWLLFGFAPTLWTYVGGGLIIGAFSLLAWDTFREEKKH